MFLVHVSILLTFILKIYINISLQSKCFVYNCSFIPQSAQPCSGSDVKIIGPNLKDMFAQKKGTLMCEVTGKSVDRIFWENEDEKEMAGSSVYPNGSEKTIVPLDITFEEWSFGAKRTCVVEDLSALDQIRKSYQRFQGKKTNQQKCRKSLCHAFERYHFESFLFLFCSRCFLQYCSYF